MKKLSQTTNNAVSFVKKNTSFDTIRSLVFQLPVERRLELYQEIREKDWQNGFEKASNDISYELKKAGLKATDVPRLIKEYRKIGA